MTGFPEEMIFYEEKKKMRYCLRQWVHGNVAFGDCNICEQ